MSFYGSMKTSFVNAETEFKLQNELRKIEMAHDGMIKVINVYKAGTGFTAWYYHDFSKAGLPKNKEVTKKTKKKIIKKVQ
jgi:hypothetical protein